MATNTTSANITTIERMPMASNAGANVGERKDSPVSRHRDVAADLAERFVNEPPYSRKEESKLLWKIDLRLIPLLFLNLSLPSVDKLVTSTAALYGMNQDTKLTGNMYALVGSAFYFGYLFACLPASQVLQRLPIPRSLMIAMVAWGFIVIGTGFAENFATLLICRIFLGVLEAPVAPSNLIVMTMWYNRQEQPVRAALFFTAGISSIYNGVIGWAVGFIPGQNAWRSLFWIDGAITVAYGIIVGIFLPANPVKARFLTERERFVAIERVRADQLGIENKNFNASQLYEVILDPKVWLMLLFNLFVSIPNGGLTNFTPLIVKGLGYSAQQSSLLMIPTGIMATVSTYVCNFGVFYFEKRWPHLHVRGCFIIGGLLIGMTATIFLTTLPAHAYISRLFALYCAYFYLGPFIIGLGINSANTAGHTKKVTSNAIMFAGWCASNIIGPQFFLSEQAPLYPLAMGALLGSYVLGILTILVYMAFCWNENWRRNRIDPTRDEQTHLDTDFQDLTDGKNIHFRYVW